MSASLSRLTQGDGLIIKDVVEQTTGNAELVVPEPKLLRATRLQDIADLTVTADVAEALNIARTYWQASRHYDRCMWGNELSNGSIYSNERVRLIITDDCWLCMPVELLEWRPLHDPLTLHERTPPELREAMTIHAHALMAETCQAMAVMWMTENIVEQLSSVAGLAWLWPTALTWLGHEKQNYARSRSKPTSATLSSIQGLVKSLKINNTTMPLEDIRNILKHKVDPKIAQWHDAGQRARNAGPRFHCSLHDWWYDTSLIANPTKAQMETIESAIQRWHNSIKETNK